MYQTTYNLLQKEGWNTCIDVRDIQMCVTYILVSFFPTLTEPSIKLFGQHWNVEGVGGGGLMSNDQGGKNH